MVDWWIPCSSYCAAEKNLAPKWKAARAILDQQFRRVEPSETKQKIDGSESARFCNHMWGKGLQLKQLGT
jgi:hypothetical protein